MSQIPVPTEDLYLYSMQLLDADYSDRIEQLLRESSEARAELVNIRGDLAYLAFSVEPETVPERARDRFFNAIASDRTVPVTDRTAQSLKVEKPAVYGGYGPSTTRAAASVEAAQAARLGKIYETGPKTGFLARVLPWVGWAVAAGLAVSTWTFHERSAVMQGQVAEAQDHAARAEKVSERAIATSERAKAVLDTLGSRSAQRFLLTRQGTAPAPSARVTYVASSGSLVFQGNNLDNVPAEKTYELWLIPANKAAKPIPAGTFKPDERGFASLILPSLPKGITAATFGITMEDTGGSQAPTLPILLIGA